MIISRRMLILTPDIQPEFLPSGATKAIHPKHGDSCTRERDGCDEAVVSGVVTPCQCIAGSGHASNKYGTAARRSNDAALFQREKPHGKAKASEEAAQPIGDVRKHERKATKDQTSDGRRNEKGALHGIGNGWVHQIDDEHGDGKTG